jgi:hypothetical protein
MLNEKQGALLESITNIMAYTMERRDEAIQILEAVQAGAALATGMTRERAVQILIESIVFYEQMLRRFQDHQRRTRRNEAPFEQLSLVGFLIRFLISVGCDNSGTNICARYLPAPTSARLELRTQY